MRADTRRTVTVQRATITTNGLGESVQSWSDDGTVTVIIAPASASKRAQAALTGLAVTHTLIAAAGFEADPIDTRLASDDLTYRLHGVTSTPAGIIMDAEATHA